MSNNIIEKLNDVLVGLKIKGRCVEVMQRGHLAFCSIELEPGQRLTKIERSLREIGLAMRSKGAPIVRVDSARGVVVLQFAFRDADIVDFYELYDEHIENRPNGILQFLLGETGDGSPLWIDMAMNPHMLVAGGTGSGKSTLLHTIIANALVREDVMLYLVDPKNGVEFGAYDSVANFVATDYDDTISMLDELCIEMERRYELLRRIGINSIEKNHYTFPKLLVIIDEVADLMLKDQDRRNPIRGKLEGLLCSLAQKSRAAGIYVVLSTQRPSVNVITGTIKANFPARLACKVSSATDSKVILDRTGAESLLGRGDAILDSPKVDNVRFQAAYCVPKDSYVNSAA